MIVNPRTMTNEQLLAFTRTLSTQDATKLTDDDYYRIGKFIKSDGCTGVPDFFLNGCKLHDFWYRTHRNLDGSPITEQQADKGLAQYIWRHSLFGRFSPMAWWRYQALEHIFAQKAWLAECPDIDI